MLSLLRRWGAEVIPSNSRARRRRTSSPPQGPPASRPVGGLHTLRSFVEPASRIPAPLRQSSQAAGALETTASAPFFDRNVSGMRRRKVQGTNTVSKLRRAPSLSASVQCEKSAALCSAAAGRPGTSSRVAGQACHTTSGTVPPR